MGWSYPIRGKGEAYIIAQVVVVPSSSGVKFFTTKARHLSRKEAVTVAAKDAMEDQLSLPKMRRTRVPAVKRAIQSCTDRDGCEG